MLLTPLKTSKLAFLSTVDVCIHSKTLRGWRFFHPWPFQPKALTVDGHKQPLKVDVACNSTKTVDVVATLRQNPINTNTLRLTLQHHKINGLTFLLRQGWRFYYVRVDVYFTLRAFWALHVTMPTPIVLSPTTPHPPRAITSPSRTGPVGWRFYYIRVDVSITSGLTFLLR